MKKIITILSAIFLSGIIFAQAPQKISYQAVIRDSENNLITGEQVGIQISIIQGESDNIPVYSETHVPTTNSNGLVSIEIGGGTTSNDFSSINWANGPYYIKTEIDPEGGSNYSITGTSQLLSVPYALYAEHAAIADSVSSLTITQWDSTYASIKDAPATISDLTMNANAQNITNVADPVDASDAATKAYVDALEAKLVELEELLIANKLIKVEDVEGNKYLVVKIGDQVWMAENLKTTKYNDGTPIDYLGDDLTAWGGTSTGAYAWYKDDSATYAPLYGALYNAYAVETEKLCPVGWHAPSLEEWDALQIYLENNGYIYNGTIDTDNRVLTNNEIAKALAGSGWSKSSKEGAPGNTDYPEYQNKSGFTALPGGYLAGGSEELYGHEYFSYSMESFIGRWWTTSSGYNGDPTLVFHVYLAGYINSPTDCPATEKSGLSVRCIRND